MQRYNSHCVNKRLPSQILDRGNFLVNAAVSKDLGPQGDVHLGAVAACAAPCQMHIG